MEELEFLKLEEALRLRLDKLKIESKMPSVLQELLLLKELLLEVDVPYFMPQKLYKIWKELIINRIWELKLLEKQLLFHAEQLLIMLDSKEWMLFKKYLLVKINHLDLMQVRANSLIYWMQVLLIQKKL